MARTVLKGFRRSVCAVASGFFGAGHHIQALGSSIESSMSSAVHHVLAGLLLPTLDRSSLTDLSWNC